MSSSDDQLFHEHSNDQFVGFPFITTSCKPNDDLHVDKSLFHETNLVSVAKQGVSWNHAQCFDDEILGEDNFFGHLDAIREEVSCGALL